ncbi:MAG: threonine--tRNA ligase [Candidatus Altiarchaeota archaeon]|nr:threonine--tRNA ligase [Candidatus Altiarchaeota archaeon]
MKIEKLLSKLGKVLDSGEREEMKWFDVDTAPLTKDDYSKLESNFKEAGGFVKIINAGSSLNKDTKKEVQRVWLVSFKNQKDLDKWSQEFEEKKKKDHRYIGEQLDWFHVQEDILGPGLPLLHPKGMIIRNGLIDLIREVNAKLGAEEIWTPHISRCDLWKISGHYEHYKNKMFMWEQDGEEWGIKAMNCPMHFQVYRFKPKSYKDLPVRYAEFATVYRKEQSGELHGLSRVWSLTQDDHHFIINPDQIEGEVTKIIDAARKVYDLFGFEYKIKLATKPEDSMGDAKLWDVAQDGLKNALTKLGVEYSLNEGDGSFYGPKIDIYVKDNMARWWQLTTIQLDFFMPDNFKMVYTDEKGKQQMPVVIHFAILGSLERFMSIIIEQNAGRLPLWLAPVQLRVLPISEAQEEYAQGLVNEMRGLGVRAEMVTEGTLGKRIRNSEMEKVAVTAVVGDKEVQANSISVRGKETMTREDFKEKILLAIMDRSDF